MCGSDMFATMRVAGGMESMTNAPHLLPKARSGIRIGHGQVLDPMLLDALQVHGLRRGVATLWIGGSEATAVAVKML